MIVNAQEAQKTVELYAEDVSDCYNVSNDYAVKISMRDFISLVKFNLVLDYSESVFSYSGPATSTIATGPLAGTTITNNAVAGTLTFAWDVTGSTPITPVTFADNVKTDVVTLHFTVNNYPNNLAASYVSPLTWTTSDFWYSDGTNQIVNTDSSTDGKLTVTVGVNNSDIAVAISAPTCSGSGSVATVTVPGGPYQYLFNEDPLPANWSWTTSNTASVSAGVNTVRVKDANGCMSLAKSFTVADIAPVSFTVSTQDAACKGGQGEIEIHAVGGTGPYTYWVVPDANWAAVQTALAATGESATILNSYVKTNFQIGKPAGVYHVVADDANSCFDRTVVANWQTVTINEPATGVAVTLGTITGETCANSDDGSIAVTVAGGNTSVTGEYKVSIDGGITWASTTEGGYTFSDLTPGTYTVTAMDDNGCTTASGNAVVTAKSPITFGISIVDTSCGGDNDGQITVSNIAGGTAPYTITITENGTNPAPILPYTTLSAETGHTFTGLKPTYYSLNITDANGCSVNYSNPNGTGNVIAVQSPADINFNLDVTNPACFDGSATITVVDVTGGSGNGYVYSLDGGAWQISNVFTVPQNLGGGFNSSYSVAVANGPLATPTCSVAQTTDANEVVAPKQLTASVSQVFAPSCKDGSDGNIYVTIAGGTMPYYYSINGGSWVETNSTLAIIKATVGTHTINIKDDNGCSIGDPLTVPVTQNDNVITASASGSINCFGGSTDAGGNKITIGVGFTSWADNGVGRVYTYYYASSASNVYTSGTGFNPTSVSPATTFLAGTYYVGAIDQFGCTATPVKVVVDTNNELLISSVVANGASCYGTFGGNITVQATGGTVSGLLQYAVVNAQSALDNIPSSKWLNFTTYNSETTLSTVSFQVEKGTYWIAVRDNNCAVKTYGPINVTGYDPLTVDETKIIVTNANCNGDENGAINIPMTAVTGGAGAYMFTLLDSEDTPITGRVQQSSSLFAGLGAGTYSVLVEDSEGCPTYTTKPITITEPAALTFNTAYSNFSCFNANDGLITVTASGGTAPYKYAINNEDVWFAFTGTSNTKTYNATEPGTFKVWVQDAHGCITGPTTVVISQPTAIVPTATVTQNVLCNGTSTGAITAAATGGWAGMSVYQYKVDNGSWQASTTFTGLAAGTHTLYVKDVNVYSAPYQALDCIYSTTFTITQPDPIVYTVSITDVKCKGGADGTFTVNVVSGGTPITGNINDALNGFIVQLTGNAYNQTLRTGSDNSVTFTGLNPSFYTVHISDANGCTIKPTAGDTVSPYQTVESWEVAEPDEALTIAPVWKKDASCYGSQDGQFVINAQGGVAPYKYYAALSIEPNGHVLVPDAPVAGSDEWQNSNTFNVGAGTWVVWAIDANGCMIGGEKDALGNPVNTWRVKIAQPTQITWAFHMMGSEPDTIHYKMPSCYGNEDGQIHLVNVAGGTPPYSAVATGKSFDGTDKVYEQAITEDPVSHLWIINNVAASDVNGYKVKVVDANSCETATQTVVIGQPKVLTLSVAKGSDSFTCPDAVEGFIESTPAGGTAPYTYSLYKDGVLHTADVTPSAFLVQIGHKFMVEVKDKNGCTATDTITINPVKPVQVTLAETTCYGDPTASVKISATGEPGRTFSVRYKLTTDASYSDWMAFDANNQIAISGLKYANITQTENFYSFQIQDSKGCEKDTLYSFVATQHPLEVTMTQSADQLSADMAITGGISPYSYQVGNGEMVQLPVDGNTFQVVKLTAPSTDVTVYDAHGCSLTTNIPVDPVSVTAVPASGNNMENTYDVVLTFNRAVSVPDTAITVTGGTATVSGTSPGTSFTVSITADDMSKVVLSLAGGVIADAAGNTLAATSFTYTVGDHVAPTVVVTDPATPVHTVFTVGLAFSEPVSGVLDKSGITVTGGTLTDVAAVAGGQNYTLTISSTEQSVVTIVLSNLIKDLSANANAFAGLTLTYTVGDFTAPELVSFTPENNSTITDNHPMLKMTFSENVQVGAGGSLNIYKVNTTTPVLTIPITAAMINGKDVTVNYTTQSGLDKDTRYYVLVDGTALEDMAGNAFAGVGDIAAWTFKTGPDFATSVPVNGSLEFKVYPNPFDGDVTVQNASKLSKIVVTNIAGQVVKQIVNPTDIIHLSELRSGVYFMSMYKSNNVIQTAKIVKR